MRHTAARGLVPAAMRRPGHFCTTAIASVPDWRGARAAHGTPAAWSADRPAGTADGPREPGSGRGLPPGPPLAV